MGHPTRRCPIFCTVDIPTSELDIFLNITEEYKFGTPQVFQSGGFDISNWMVIMTSEDVSEIPHSLTQPIQPFRSPFLGKSIEEIAAWYDANIIQPKVPGFYSGAFIVMDEDALQQQICAVVNMKKGLQNIELLGCEWILALHMASILNLNHPFEDAVIEKYMRNNILMTLENLELAMNSGRYLEGMEVKINEEWKDFDNW
ncbi:hypothetical protein JR316_0008684 [Psilocybe cubensis]|uniref:Uncharacterized protein n=2 Tax=Psilocybe cubensis TaxID=181762 RepID=A0A8H7XUG5_PSICU|nr:hypothetical protein JR316_0008684 [Psilocybe cubensis]KAH9478231.1 hypothetical protein JR316_0008684 [Psilocybe cubensis]